MLPTSAALFTIDNCSNTAACSGATITIEDGNTVNIAGLWLVGTNKEDTVSFDLTGWRSPEGGSKVFNLFTIFKEDDSIYNIDEGSANIYIRKNL